MRRIMYTSDPYEPSGTIGIYETEEQRQTIIDSYIADMMRQHRFASLGKEYFLKELFEEDIEIGVYYA